MKSAQEEESKQIVTLPIRPDKSQKLRQLQEESERYRACIESGHQLMQQPMIEKDQPFFQKSQSEHSKYSLAGQGYKQDEHGRLSKQSSKNNFMSRMNSPSAPFHSAASHEPSQEEESAVGTASHQGK